MVKVKDPGSDFGLTSSCFRDLLSRARNGEHAAVGQLLQAARQLLVRFAEKSLDADFQAKLSASDLVQETCLEAQRDFAAFRGQSQAELLGWLRKMLVNNLLNQYRDLRRHKRDIAREQALDTVKLNPSYLLADNIDTPSRIAVRREEEQRLELALETLPHDYREVILLRHREHLSFVQIGERMNRSADAARMLWYRAFEQLSREVERLS
ncbi:MAG: sigma-70 family RNA polymerase sigma factor [Planctomycetales bacterium]|nr:sigma-70 family RNA polymerase sigma factor [Planctomycetales bacterium]